MIQNLVKLLTRMEDFLNEIDEKFIQERIDKLKEIVEKQKRSIVQRIQRYRVQLLAIIPSKVNKKNSLDMILNPAHHNNPSSLNKNQESKQILSLPKSGQIHFHSVESNLLSHQQVQDCFLLFEKACSGVINTYFPLMMQDEFLSLQTQSEIHEKLNCLKKVVERSSMDLIKMLSKSNTFCLEKQSYHLKKDDINDEENSIQISNQSEEKAKTKKKISKKQKAKKQGRNTKIPLELTWHMQKWLLQHFNDPYPTHEQKQKMSFQSGLTIYQVNNWFINARQRVIKKFLKKNNTLSQLGSEDSWENNEEVKVMKRKKNNNSKFNMYLQE